MAVTMQDIARDVGVSVVTVSKVLRNKRALRPRKVLIVPKLVVRQSTMRSSADRKQQSGRT